MPYSDPDKSRTYQRQYHRMRRAGEMCQTPVKPRLPGEFRLTTAEDVIALLGEQLDAVRDKLDSVKERLYRGQCIDRKLLDSTLAQFKQNERELYALVDGQDGLHIYRKRQVRRYIDQFYEDFESERAIERNFLKECR